MKGILLKPDMIEAIIEGRKTQTRRVIKNKRKPWGNFELGKPGYQVGEIVYIKEGWAKRADIEGNTPKAKHYLRYKLDSPDLEHEWHTYLKWESPLFMPTWAARYFIKVTGVKAERLQEITEDDCLKEGCPQIQAATGLCLQWYKELWDSINPKYRWSSNPWVFAYSFETTKGGVG